MNGLHSSRSWGARSSSPSSTATSSGFASVGACHGDDDAGELYAIYLHPLCWDRGIGRALLEQAEESMRSSGFAQAILWVMEGNQRAERFYRAAGWERDGRKLDTFQGAEVAELCYRKVL